MSKVEKVQSGYKAQPLSAYRRQPAPPAAPPIDFLPATTAGIKGNFFQYLDAALQFVPETARDKSIRAKLAKIGIGPGKTFAFKDLSVEHKAEILLGMKRGDEKVDSWLSAGKKHRRLECWFVLWRRDLLQRRLGHACRRYQGRAIRQ
jgi:hypothetical protein